MLLMLASTVGEDSGAGLLSERESHHQAAYDVYGEQEVQVLCSVAPRVLSDRAASSSFFEEKLLGSYRLERDNLGFYTEHPIPEKQLMDRSLEARMGEKYGERKELSYGGGPKEPYGSG